MEETIFDTLYSLDKKNKIKEWSIKVINRGDFSEIITLYGYDKKVENTLKVAKGKNTDKKNSTTHYEQAIKDAQSKWNKKRDMEGYTTENLKLDLQNSSVGFDKIFPMLAQDYNKHKNKLKFPCFIQPKLDGYRMIYDSAKNLATSRQGKEFGIIKKTNKLYGELQNIKSTTDIILDGELYIHGGTFEHLGVLRKTKELTSQETEMRLNKIEYHVYDIIDENLTFKERNEILKNLFEKNNFTMIKYVDTRIINNDEELNEAYTIFTNELQYEGAIIRNQCGKYKCKFRSMDLLKRKDFEDSEFKIINFTFEKDITGNDENLIVWVCETSNGQKFNVRPQGCREERQRLYNNGKEYIGKNLWVKYFELTDSGIPRFPTTKTNNIDSYIRDTIE